MGSAPSGRLLQVADASQAEITSTYAELSPESRQTLQEALKQLPAATSTATSTSCLACRSLLSGEVTARLPGASEKWSYMDLATALRTELPEARAQVIQFFTSQEPLKHLDEYKTLEAQDFDLKGDMFYSLANLSVGEPMGLGEAQPLLLEARARLDRLDKRGISEMRALVRPPQAVVIVAQATACLLQKPRSTWADVKKTLIAKELLHNLFSFDKDHVPLEALVELQWYLNHPYFERDEVRRASLAADGLREWVMGINAYSLARERVQIG
ncbi:Dynein axonemal heavy chain 6 (Axonemal beta dynein heavy chain 6) (Ciliary dynein heavy chain 6) [Durusdinium trenchii]|uniref:Dynein axonemal heavy chain 6 (Axonemal beta dynein heavy chain 6) (Ciliary dynein heavy chain 6) n=1 Tax=Durusdinium trenchii TaxID=1381693 RepID=A0ABP0HJ31_9DINO